MIAQLLNRTFLMDSLRVVVEDLEAATAGDDRRGGAPHPADGVSSDDFRQAADAAAAVLASFESATEAEPAVLAGRETSGVAPAEDWAFVPADPLLSILQSTLERWVDENAFEAEGDLPDDDRRGGLETMVTDRWIDGLPPQTTANNRRWFGPFEVAKPKLFSDPRWISAVFAIGYRSFRGRHAFNEVPASYELERNARIVMVGDWGSGIRRALKVRDQMRVHIEEGIARKLPTHVIHLGDVYYSGFEWEYDQRFLDPWPTSESDDVRSWTLAGNHDMYSGGHGYYEKCLNDSRFACQSHSSWFRLSNADWQIVGLDSAWEEGALKDPQGSMLEEWERQTLAKFLLLTHHQPFSVLGRSYPKLLSAVSTLRANDRVTGWMWGHEHRCVVYAPHEGVTFGRLLGNGGIPEYMTREPADPYTAPETWELRERRTRLEQPWNTFGFAVLDVDGPRIDVRYFNEDGALVYGPEHFE